MRPKKYGAITVDQRVNRKRYDQLRYQIAIKPFRKPKPLQMKDRVRCPCCGMLSTPKKLKQPEAEPLEYLLQELRAGFKHHRAEHMISPILIKEKLTDIGKKISQKMLNFSLKFMTLEEIKKFFNIKGSKVTQITSSKQIQEAISKAKSGAVMSSPSERIEEAIFKVKSGAVISPNYAGV